MSSSRTARSRPRSPLLVFTALTSAIFIWVVQTRIAPAQPGGPLLAAGAALCLLCLIFLAGALFQFLRRALVLFVWCALTAGVLLSIAVPAGTWRQAGITGELRTAVKRLAEMKVGATTAAVRSYFTVSQERPRSGQGPRKI